MTKKIIKKEKVNNRGAPVKQDTQRVDGVTHLYVWQRKRNQEEAAARGITEFAMARIIHDWYYTALDKARSDSDAFKMFDKGDIQHG